MEEKIKVLIDTDLGDDIDDALALAWALETPALDVVGVTTPFGNTNERARIGKKLLSMAGRADIPVYAGVCDTIVKPVKPWSCCQRTPDIDAPEFAPVNDAEGNNGEAAIDFIVDCAKKYGKELTIVAIGPLGNIARAFQKDAAAMNGTKGIVIMGGCFYGHFAEWNILCDAEAAKIVFEQAENLTCVGVDVTGKTKLTKAQTDRILAYETDVPWKKYLIELVGMWVAQSRDGLPCLHDPLALSYLTNPEFLFMDQAIVEVETEGHFSRGMTFNVDEMLHYEPLHHNGKKTTIARDIRAKAFVEYFINKVFG